MPRKSCALALVVACAGAQARERGETEARSARDAQHAKRPELREALRRWIIAHQNELPTVFPERSLSHLPEILAGCSEEASDQLATSLGPLEKAMPGLEYFVGKAQEQTRICRAVRQVQAPSVAAFLSRAPVVRQRAASQ